VARTTIDDLLENARRRLERASPAEALAAMKRGAAVIDIRSDSQIAEDGSVPGALIIARNVLEWRLDPASDHRHPRAPGLEDHVILMCNEGYQSSLAAATLQQLGFARATDMAGGFQAWRAAGLPADPSGSPVAEAPATAPTLDGSQSSVSVSQNANPANSR
jgi:rhodanese-related sulfurtransferase